ncbi:MAG: hypothetical protein U1E17_08435 [Geminicoccaceae bacterium]
MIEAARATLELVVGDDLAAIEAYAAAAGRRRRSSWQRSARRARTRWRRPSGSAPPWDWSA